MTLSRPTIRIALLVSLLAIIVLSLFGSLVLADRALATTDRRAVALDAREASIHAERELLRRGNALTALSPTRATSDAAILEFDAVWLLDSAGRTIWRSAAGIVDDTAALTRLAADIAQGAWPTVRVTASGAVLLATPYDAAGSRAKVAVGRVAAEQLLDVLRQYTSDRARFALKAGGRVVATRGEGTASRMDYTAADTVAVSGDVLTIVVSQPRSRRGPRTLLWVLGTVALAGLLAGLARERTQALSLAERTAELERLYQEVARSNRMKSEFLANVSHELRTPLNAIVGFVEMLREGVYGELTPRQALPVDRIAASATHLRHLVDRLLDIAKIAAGRLEVQLEPVVLRPFVLNVASEMESLVAERGLTLSIAISPGLPRIRTDQTHLRQILINLIGNAVKYTTTGGIQMRADLAATGAAPAESPANGRPPGPDRPWVAVQVTDTGVGIQPADLERIFDEFEQVNAGARTDSARRGTGLGLAISRRLAKLLGGDLTVVSEPGQGSTFTVWLPVDQDLDDAVSPEPRDQRSA
jgi:signal transduction histidine kinase